MLLHPVENDGTVRLFFHVQDNISSVGITGCTAASGPQVSVNGAAWATTGVGTFTEVGLGWYYVDVDLDTLVPSVGDIVVGYVQTGGTVRYVYSENAFLITSDSYAWASLADALKSLDTDVGYIQGSGFATGSHSLVALRSYLASSVTPNLTSTTTATSITDGSWLERVIATARRMVDEPSVNQKWSDTELIEILRNAWAELWIDLNATNQSPIVVRYDVILQEDVQDYVLPSNIGQLRRVRKVASETGLTEWEVDWRQRNSLVGHGIRIEGNILRLGRKWTSAEVDTVTLEYVPNGDCHPVCLKYTASAAEATFISNSTKVLLDGLTNLTMSVEDGKIDTRPNAYAGYVMRVFPAAGTAFDKSDPTTYTQERTVKASVLGASSAYIEIRAAFDPSISIANADSQYVELIPQHGLILENVLAFRIALNLLSPEGDATRYKMIEAEYRKKLRSARLQAAAVQVIRPQSYERTDRTVWR